jgi:hypothetical protein
MTAKNGSGNPGAGSAPVPAKKVTLEDVLGTANFEPYRLASEVAKSYEVVGNHSTFNPNVMGRGLYRALQGIYSEIPNQDDKLELQMMDALQKSLQSGSLTRQSFEATLEHAKSFLGPYLNRIRGTLEDSHYKLMAMGALQNPEMFAALGGKLAAHPSATRAVELGKMLKDIEDELKSNDLSNIGSYFGRLKSKSRIDAYVSEGVKAGKTEAEARAEVTTTLNSGEKAYQALVGGLSQDMKRGHQQLIQKLVANGLYTAAQGIDVGHIKSVMATAAPYDVLALIPRGKNDNGYIEQ